MLHRGSLARFAVALALAGVPASVRADVVLLNNLDQPVGGSTSNAFVGQSFIAGTVDQPLFGARMMLNSAPSPGIELEVEARNANGTVGATLFSNFSVSFDPTTFVIKFTTLSSFTLKAGTGYWLVLSDPSAGSVNWTFTASNVYQSQFGYGLPSFNTSWTSNADNGQGSSTYFQPSDGPQLFQLIAPTLVPEPSSWILLGSPMAIAVVTLLFRAPGAAGRWRPAPGPIPGDNPPPGETSRSTLLGSGT